MRQPALIVSIALLPSVAWASQLQVVTTTTTLASITRSVGGQHVEVESICAGDQDPHFIHARPSYMRVVADADLFVRIGLELEKAWEVPLLRGSRNSAAQYGATGHLDVSAGIAKLGVPSGQVDRSMGDIHLLGNPHYWLDPYNGRLIARSIVARLVKLRPSSASDFRNNLKMFERTIDARMFGDELVSRFGGEKLWQQEIAGDLDAFLTGQGATAELSGWRALTPQLSKTPVITFHRSWTYLAARFRIPVVERLEPKPGLHPSPSHLVRVITAIHQHHVRALILEPYYDRKVADFVAGKTHVPVVVLPNAPGPGTGLDGYVAMLDNAIKSIVSHAPRS